MLTSPIYDDDKRLRALKFELSRISDLPGFKREQHGYWLNFRAAVMELLKYAPHTEYEALRLAFECVAEFPELLPDEADRWMGLRQATEQLFCTDWKRLPWSGADTPTSRSQEVSAAGLDMSPIAGRLARYPS
ncbi:hypothetical protein [Erythrobacter rubeus]|uniref:DUF2267 domain-containing protein n=1 Tax=Erythrobacter rubeus TaxID=2760803 RepID=A0ABR8KPW6_9SPHN|nr:hypothetical protein [Erythrobacter rubeus]MBD2842724.1 hypothetical protein [Erythrobacter rubeus]